MSFQIYFTYHMMKGVVLYFVLLSLALVAMTTRGDCDSEVQCARKSRDRLLLCHSSCNTLPRSRLTCLKTCYLDAYGKIKDCIEEERKTKWCKIWYIMDSCKSEFCFVALFQKGNFQERKNLCDKFMISYMKWRCSLIYQKWKECKKKNFNIVDFPSDVYSK